MNRNLFKYFSCLRVQEYISGYNVCKYELKCYGLAHSAVSRDTLKLKGNEVCHSFFNYWIRFHHKSCGLHSMVFSHKRRHTSLILYWAKCIYQSLNKFKIPVPKQEMLFRFGFYALLRMASRIRSHCVKFLYNILFFYQCLSCIDRYMCLADYVY